MRFHAPRCDYTHHVSGERVAPTLASGTELAGRYTIEAPISSGGMGAVFAAIDAEAGGRVAVKHVTEAHGARFEIEARLLTRLEHPRVVRVLDHFSDQHGMYLVMDLIEGEDLAEALRHRGDPGLPVREAVTWALQACEALRYVHEQQIVHRDLKPANLIAGEDGVVLVDFGIAREFAAEGDATIGIGTPRFMAPEVLSGGAASPRTDVYGLAATLWMLIGGRRPPHGPLPSISTMVRRHSRARADAACRPRGRARARIPSAEAFAKALGSPRGPSKGAPLVSQRGPAEGTARAARRDRPHRRRRLRCRVGLGGPGRPGERRARLPGRLGRRCRGDRWGPARAGGGHRWGGDRDRRGGGHPQLRRRPRFAADVAGGTGYVPNTMLVVPLERAGQVVGVLSLLDRRDGGSYGTQEVERARLFADLALSALGLEDARRPAENEGGERAQGPPSPEVITGPTREDPSP